MATMRSSEATRHDYKDIQLQLDKTLRLLANGTEVNAGKIVQVFELRFRSCPDDEFDQPPDEPHQTKG
jgi:hypothetical protein